MPINEHPTEPSAFEAIVNDFRKTFGLSDFRLAPEKEESPVSESKIVEERTFPLDEAVRVLRKIEKNVDNDPFVNQNDLIAVADRYIKLAEITLQYEVDN